MGTRGYAIYYHKGFYFLYYYHYDAYPEGLGVKFMKEIPADPVEFEEYVAAKKEELDGLLRDLERSHRDEYEDDDDEKDLLCGQDMETIWKEENTSFEISRKWPRGADAAYMYEINLEHYIFYVDGEPYFDLRNMPNEEFFCAYLYPGAKYELPSNSEKARHRYKLPPSPPVAANLLETYKGYSTTSKANTTHELLDLPPEMRSSELIRMEIMQVFVGASMKTMNYANYGLGERTTLFSSSATPRLIHRVRTMVDFFTGPLVFSESMPPFGDRYLPDRPAFQWIDWGLLCLLVVPRLDVEDNLPAAVVKLVEELKSQMAIPASMTAAHKPVVFFAIISSLYHISIVRIEVPISHTPALQFLPLRDAKTLDYPPTPGIKAISRPGQMTFEQSPKYDLVLKNERFHETAPSLLGIGSLPTELCLQIAEYLPLSHLQAFATLSPRCAQAADVEFRWGGACFEAVKYGVLNSSRWRSQFDEKKVIGRFWYHLEPNPIYSRYYREFQAVDQHGDKVVVRLSPDHGTKPISNVTKPSDTVLKFEVGTEWCGPPHIPWGDYID
ncbi:hypothetical protein BT96DRAFT_927630 [Gymnopus androsaceus JB14]|uniref:F-box domain-containing protein n=1 Tax=Gymnopus androsaceus JB14 TaxID=1447944 RepID=A0A6A4GQ94_9AGAR|nr:hypothetical protein BT96DRAFT_927630 [Gymnopus androsaceus JB14]